MMIRVLKNFSGGGATLPDFLHVGVRDVWPNAQHELRLGDNLLRCFQNCCFSPYIGDEFSPMATFPDLSKPRRSSSSEGSAERTGSEPNKVSCQRQQ